MAVFTHRNELRARDLEGLPPETQRIVRAAFAVAQQAHAGQSRGKLDPSVQYISHPLMVYDIMRHMQVEDPVMLASALLHDALEDCAAYRDHRDLMTSDLFQALEKTGGGEIGNLHVAERIQRLCETMTNPEHYPVHKLAYQVERVRGMKKVDTRILKMADQMASLICHLIAPEDSTIMPPDKVKKFGDKAVVLIHAVLDSYSQDPLSQRIQSEQALHPWRVLMSHIEPHYRRLLMAETPEAKADARAAFAADTLREPVKLLGRPGKYHIALLSQAYEKAEDGAGITRIEYGVNGRVVGFECWVAEGGGPQHPRNRVERALCEAIQSNQRDIEVHLRAEGKPVILTSIDAQGKQCEHAETQQYRLSKPIDQKTFLRLAIKAGALASCDAREVSVGHTGRVR